MGKVFIQESTLTAIGDAIRSKTEKTDLIAPGDMPREILAIVSGGGGGDSERPTDAELTFRDYLEYTFANGSWDWVIELYGNRMTTNQILSLNHTFTQTKVKNIPFNINCENWTTTNMWATFEHAEKLESLPRIYNAKPNYMNYFCSDCAQLKEIPDNYFDTWDMSAYGNASSEYETMSQAYMFNDCTSLRKLPLEWLTNGTNPHITSSYLSVYSCLFNGCVSLDTIENLPVSSSLASPYGNLFDNTFKNCWRIKDMTFAPFDGTLDWSGQTIDLTHAGYPNTASSPTYVRTTYYNGNYNNGITDANWVQNETGYNSKKNTEDWFTTSIEYSRYNHDSAVRTINSLPTTSGSGCTIKFSGAAGSGTDGGAINTLTEAEIAVAAAKGWTVTLV